MKAIIIDTNIILDFFFERKDHISAAKILDLCITGKVRGHICVHELTTIYYLLKKNKESRAKIRKVMEYLLDCLLLLYPDENIFRESLDSKIGDYEDAVIERIGVKHSIDFIITNNIKDFKKGEIKAITAITFIESPESGSGRDT